MQRDDLLAAVEAPGAALLDGWSDDGRWTIVLPHAVEEARFDAGDDARLDAFLREASLPRRAAPDRAAMRAATDRAAMRAATGGPPFSGGWVGFLSYELGARREGAADRAETAEPAALFYRHESGWAIDPSGRGVPIGSGAPPPPPCDPFPGVRFRESPVESLPGDRYRTAHEAIREGIARGDFYQVNLTTRFRARVAQRPDPREIWRRMTAPAPPPYALLLRGDTFDIVSASPELFLRADFASSEVEMRPIKGTAPRFPDAERDAGSARRLEASAKDRAENVMITDLCRNDLGKVCEPGSVDVPALCRIRSHRVHHLESTITGRMRPEVSAADLVRATFPPGSVTGAPKRAAVAAIRALEPVPRGVYTGAAGFIDARGRVAFNVAIRTAVSRPDAVRYHAGGGITWDSDAGREREEVGWKAEEFFALFGGES